MDRRIGVLALASFAMGTEAYVYAGHLEAMARDLGSPVASAGQIATVFALTYALSAPIIAGLVAHFDRRRVLVAGLVMVGAINLLAAFATSLPALTGLRFLAGLAAGLVGPISSLAAAELAPPEQRGKAMALVMAGVTLAFILGIPMGSVIGDWAGWRGTFGYAGFIALIAGLALYAVLPVMPGRSSEGIDAFRAALAPAIAGNLALTLVGFAATFTTIAYVGPVVTAISGLEGSGIGAMQALIGVGSIFGIVIGGRAADRAGSGRLVTFSFLISALALGLYSLLMMGASVDATQSAFAWPKLGIILLLATGMMIGAASLFARIPIIQTRLVGEAPLDARAVILALNGSMVFLGQGIGAGLGGLTVSLAGLPFVGITAAIVALAGAAMASRVLSTRQAAEIASKTPLHSAGG
jgi:MFS transporter, DHA1 family, inner membrane transport protein